MIFNVSYKSNQHSKHKLFPVLNCGIVNKKFRLEIYSSHYPTIGPKNYFIHMNYYRGVPSIAEQIIWKLILNDLKDGGQNSLNVL